MPRRRIPIPYDLGETLSWIGNNLFGPSSRYAELTDFIPQSTELNEIRPMATLAFYGDIMQMKDKRLEFGDGLKAFFADADWVVGNFEGTITSTEGVPMASVHREEILEDLERLAPAERTVLTNANNHTCDFGWAEFERSYALQRRHGFRVVGRKDEPSIRLGDHVNLANVTRWSNQRCTHLAELADVDAGFDPEAALNVLSPHWGYEMQLYPDPEQIALGRKLLEKWDLIVGHHTHSPQVITAYDVDGTRKLLAYSLGDFSTYLGIDKYRHGIVLKVEVGPDPAKTGGPWRVGRVEWRCSIIDQVDDETTLLRLADRCALFPPLGS